MPWKLLLHEQYHYAHVPGTADPEIKRSGELAVGQLCLRHSDRRHNFLSRTRVPGMMDFATKNVGGQTDVDYFPFLSGHLNNTVFVSRT